MDQTREVLAKLLKDARARKGLTQKEVCTASGIVLRSYQRIEAAELSPKLETLSLLTKALGSQFLQEYVAYLEDRSKSSGSSFTAVEFNHTQSTLSQLPMVVGMEEVQWLKKCFVNDTEVDTASLGYWEWNTVSNETYLSPQIFEIYQIDPESEFDAQTVPNRIVDEDMRKIEDALNQLITRGIPFGSIHRLKNDQNLEVWVRSQGRRFLNEKDQLIIFGIAELLERGN